MVSDGAAWKFLTRIASGTSLTNDGENVRRIRFKNLFVCFYQ